MKFNFSCALAIAIGFASSSALYAADPPAKDTITVVAENATPDDVVSTIALPTKASEKGREQAKKGLDKANAAGETPGNATSAAAKEQGREFGERMSEEARQSNSAAQAREAANDADRGKGQDRRPPPPPKK